MQFSPKEIDHPIADFIYSKQGQHRNLEIKFRFSKLFFTFVAILAFLVAIITIFEMLHLEGHFLAYRCLSAQIS